MENPSGPTQFTIILVAHSALQQWLDSGSQEVQGAQDGREAQTLSGGDTGTNLVILDEGVYPAVPQG